MPSLPPANNYYHTDDHGPALPADVYSDQDIVEEDDDAGRTMLYGDYLDDEYLEEDEEMEEEGPVYQHEDFPQLSAPRSSYPQMTREMATLPPPDPRLRPTRDLRMPINAPPSSQIQARTQEVKRYNRTTQPLNPQLVAAMQRERELPPAPQALPQPQRVSRQIVPREQPRVPTRFTPIPTSSTAPIAARSVCPRCRGAGYLRLDVPFGHPNFGKPIACECKESERKEKRRQQLREMSNLDAFHSHTFRTFNGRVPGVQEASHIAEEYAQNPDGWLLLVGPNGSGKTHLAAAIANQCLDNGSVVLFSVVPDLLDHLRAAFAPNAAEVYDQLFAKMREAEVLVLDDLGAQQSSPWANEKLFQLLNYRYNLGMPTVITANPRGLQGIDERIRSRLTDVSLIMAVNLDRARDYRPNHPRRRD
jgi:DNA replication protein DnaC